MKSLRLLARAKINLCLRVLGRRPDGFHEIDSIFQSISLADEVLLTLRPEPGLEIVCAHPLVPSGPANIVYQAVHALGGQPSGLAIEIKKHIPAGAGLGGGSADAAAVLVGLNQLWGLGLSVEALMEIGAGVGADVPFCLVGGAARVRGKGEKVTLLDPFPVGSLLLVKPGFSVSTAWAYAQFDQGPRSEAAPGIHYYNDLEGVVAAAHPEVGVIKERILALGAAAAQMSGSGPAVFGLFQAQHEAEHAFELLRQEYAETFLVEAAGRGIEPV